MHSLDLLLKAVKCREEGPLRQIQETRIKIEIIDINMKSLVILKSLVGTEHLWKPC